MTSKLTRERIELIANFHREMTLPPSHAEIEELARMMLAAMDSEPVAYMYDGEDGREYNGHNEFSGGGKGIPLYRHAQQPVVPDDVLDALQKVARIRLDMNEFDGDRRGIADCLGDAEEALIEVVNCRAAILQAQSDDDGEPTDDERIMAIEGIHNCERCGDEGWVMGEMGITRCACGQAGNSPVIPDGYVMVPMRLTAENGAKGVLSGEFSETKFVNCPECFGGDECETCDGSGRIEIKVPVSWTTIKDIWIKGIEHFAAAPQEVQVVPEKIEQSRKRVDRCDVCTEGARGWCGTCIFNGNFE